MLKKASILFFITLLFILNGCSPVQEKKETVPKKQLSEKKITAPVPEAPKPAPKPVNPPPGYSAVTISLPNIQSHVKELSSEIGKRVEGAEGEQKAASYIIKRLYEYGYNPKEQAVPLPNGLTSINIIADAPVRVHEISTGTIVLGAHIDTKFDSPGANDNGTGIGILLELARCFQKEPPAKKVRFVFFGAEEAIDKDPDHHHYGSQYYVDSLSEEERRQISGMLSVDMLGYGRNFNIHTIGIGSRAVAGQLIALAKTQNVNLVYKKSPDWSDHGPFEKAGIPAAWLQWRSDPAVHTPKDDFAHIQWDRVMTSAKLLLAFCEKR